jgi:hypothetical protein
MLRSYPVETKHDKISKERMGCVAPTGAVATTTGTDPPQPGGLRVK